ncbi:MAG TPA: tetratricopeptide repeat protein [Holophagaceae bacterium]|nr:tetratricopeptide repeat protein [Holophagaceae bacterium]
MGFRFRPRRIRFLAAALAPLLALSLFAAPDPGPAGTDAEPAVALSHRVEHLKAALEKGQNDQIDAAMAEVDALRRRYSTLDVMPLVDAMSLWARHEGLIGRPQLGLEALDRVERWAPQHPSILSSRIVLQRQTGFNGWLLSVPDLLRLTAKRLEHPAQRWLWMLQHFGGLRLMATLLLWGWALSLVLRYRNVLRNLWEEPLRARGQKPVVLAVLGALILSVPVLLGLDPSVAAMLWLVLLAPFMHAKEARMTVVVLCLQLFHPLLSVMEPWAVRTPAPSLVTYQMQPQVQPLSEVQLQRLAEGDRVFLAGWAKLQHQDWAGAAADFQSLDGKHPDQGQVLNNLGVAHFMSGNAEKAESEFNRAFQADPQLAETLMNQSILSFGKLDTAAGAMKQEAARSMNPALFSELVMLNEGKGGAAVEQRAYPSPLPDSPERVKALEAATNSAADLPEPALGSSFIFSLVLPIMAMGIVLKRFKGGSTLSHSAQCLRCGDPFHITDSTDPEVCSQCHHLFVVKDGLHAERRKLKVEQLARHQKQTRWIHKVLIAFLPGCDSIFMGDTDDGFWDFLLVCLALGVVLATGPTVRYPGEIVPDPSSLWLPIGSGLLLLFFVRSWVKLFPRRRY